MAKTKTPKPSTNGHYPTTAVEWKKPREEGELVPLPSGNWARLRPVDLLKMVKMGRIPDLLSPIAAKAVWAEQNPEEIGDSLEMAMQYNDLMGVILPAVFIEPKVALPDTEPADDEIAIEDIELNDRMVAFNLAISGVSAMRQFRERQEEFMAVVSDSSQDGNTAV